MLETSNAVLSARNVGKITGDGISFWDKQVEGAVVTVAVNGVEYGNSKSGKKVCDEGTISLRSRRQNSYVASKSQLMEI